MAIQKTSLVNLVGNMTDLDKTLLECLNSGYFHPELSIHSTDPTNGFTTVEGENPYALPLNNIIRLAAELNVPLAKHEFNAESFTINDINNFIDGLEESVVQLGEKKRTVKESIYQHEQALIQIKHLAGLNASFDDIFACEYVKVRFGRLPYDSFDKLNYYDNKTFFFFPFDHDDEYYWGVYFAPATKIAVIDDIFTSLYFERVRVPDYAHGTPEVATGNINTILTQERLELTKIRDEISVINKQNSEKVLEIFSYLKFINTVHDMRKNVATVNNRFYLIGFIPHKNEVDFDKRFDNIESVSCVFKPYDADPTLVPPVRLTNSRFARPFEMFVNMYSLPSYNDIDPTSLVAITYTLLFGIMFGDLGQGLLLSLIGVVITKITNNDLGRIMTRIGFSSAFFGIVYGSVFGYEELLDPFYKAVFGLSTKPIHVFDTTTTNILLGGAIGIGAMLIIISMAINVYVGLRAKDYERAVFGHNGIAGIILYVSAVVGAVSTLLFKVNVMNAFYVTFLIVLPILVIFFRSPLANFVSKRKDAAHHSVGEFIIENFFELFEYLLSYLSNSMSFLRVGGFILSHAGMMAVVMSLSEMAGVASPIVMIIGNLFVMCLEGLIVGIQVLRLEFYEIFSRNFEGNGKPFVPATVVYKIKE